MKLRSSQIVSLGAASGFLGVILGAFGAHGLRERISEHALSIYHTGVEYQITHALALVALGIWVKAFGEANDAVRSAGERTAWLFLAGSVFFSGSLYALALSGFGMLGAVAPLGGLSLIAGWLSWAIAAWSEGRPS